MKPTLLTACLILAASIPALAQNPVVEQVRQQYDQQQYQPALMRISSVLASNMDLTAADRYELYLIQGKSLLQVGNTLYAHRALLDAARVAPEREQAIHARALAALARLSTKDGYHPRAGGPPIPINTPDNRKRAMGAAFDDLYIQTKPKIEAAVKAGNLSSVRAVLQTCYDLYCLEVASTGKSTRTDPLLTAFGDRAYTYVNTALARLNDRAEFYHARASQLVISNYGPVGNLEYRGLNSIERRELSGIAEDLRQIHDMTDAAIRTAKDFGREGQRWQTLLQKVDADIRLCQDTFRMDTASGYSGY